MRATLLVVIVVLTGALIAHAAQRVQLPADLAGTYIATGSSPAGTYTATVEILAHERVYEVRWTFPNGESMRGVGFVVGDVFVVGFDPLGVGVYRAISERPLTLEAQWTGWGFTDLHQERIAKGPPARRAAR